MQVTLAGTLLRIQWRQQAPEIEAEIVRRLESIYSAIKGNQPNTWYVHLNRLEDVMEAFPKAEYDPLVWAAWQPGQRVSASYRQPTLLDVSTLPKKRRGRKARA